MWFAHHASVHGTFNEGDKENSDSNLLQQDALKSKLYMLFTLNKSN